MTTLFSPPSLGNAFDIDDALKKNGYAVLTAPLVAEAAGCDLPALCAFNPLWNDLPPDGYLKDGGRYRRRRHSCFVVDASTVAQVPHRAHWQPVEYNALHGGMQRWFEPMDAALLAHPVWRKLLVWLAAVRRPARAACRRAWFPSLRSIPLSGRKTPMVVLVRGDLAAVSRVTPPATGTARAA